ncbi:MAG TPA: DUF1501 domain-containing protein [Casimicrobiaceae bacterium]|nr:DUF1501 domain-containing protein [Casimicrobiaceae bacterium]
MGLDALRRRLLLTAGGLTAAGLVPRLSGLALPQAAAQVAPDYRALVCVFLYGGADSNDMVVPLDDYGPYAATRGRTGMGLGEAELVPIAPASPGRRFGLHPALGDLAPLFAARKLAVVCNVGTLVAPLTRASYLAGAKSPRNLFSHSDQQLQWQGLVPGALVNTGWGGRVADRTSAGNPALAIPGVISLDGDALFTVGETTVPLALPGDGGNGLAGDPDTPWGRLRLDTMRRLLAVERDNLIVAKAADTMDLALRSAETVNSAIHAELPAVDTAFNGVYSDLADQLRRIATLIAGRSALGVRRHLFFAAMGGYDTHASQRGELARRLDELGPALAAFQRALDALGVGAQVTTFTLSDFNRTFRVNANDGTDHAWGGHQFVMGGAVKGGTFYGTFPTLAVGGPDDAGDEGQWIPTTALDQVGATLARWFGVPPAELGAVFPNLAAFVSQDLGFLA